jgi:hypothetical protein
MICEYGTTCKYNGKLDFDKKAMWIKESQKWLNNEANKYNVISACYYNINLNKNDIDSAIFTDIKDDGTFFDSIYLDKYRVIRSVMNSFSI